MNVTTKTQQILEKCGWKPGRKIDISKTVEFLELKGFDVFPCVKAALEEFGGIFYSFPQDADTIETFHFIPEKALGTISTSESFDEFEYLFNEPLVVIGVAFRGHMLSMMTKSGCVYGHYGSSLVKFGNNIYEALDTLCYERDGEQIMQ